MTAEERFAVVFEKLKETEPQEGVTVVSYEPSREAEEIRRLVEVVAEITIPKYQFITNA